MTRLLGLLVALVYTFLYGPILVLLLTSFNAARYATHWEGWTLQWYRNLLDNQLLVDATVRSLVVAVAAATVATMLGTLGAVALDRFRFRGRDGLQGLLFITMMTPDIVLAIALLILFIVLSVPLGFWSLLPAHVTFCIPFVVVTVQARLSGLDRSLLEAARDLGAGEWAVFFRVILPLSLPAVIAGWLLAFTLSLDDVIVSFFVTGPEYEILPLKIYSMVRLGVKPEVNALAALMFLVPLAAVSAAHFLLRERDR
jgi:spermidine/putrescine transport system permease protein